MWLKSLKIAILEKNTEKMAQLMDALPQFEKQEDIASALVLISEAKKLVVALRDDTALSMAQMKKNIDFLESTQRPHTAKLDISS